MLEHSLLFYFKFTNCFKYYISHSTNILFIVQYMPKQLSCLMVFNATFNNISVISWRSVLLVEETGVPENTTDMSQVTEKLYHIMLYTSPCSRFELASVVIGTDCIGCWKSNYHNITVTPKQLHQHQHLKSVAHEARR